MARSFDLLCEEVLQEWLGQRKRFEAVFDSSKCADLVKNFHEKCDTCGPNVTVFYCKNNTMIGAFTSQSWKPQEGIHFKADKKAFLFKIFSLGRFEPWQFAVDDERFAIYCSKDSGPAFGGCRDRREIEITRNPRKQSAGSGNVNVSYSMGKTFAVDIESKQLFERALREVTKFKVFKVKDDDSYIDKEWRNVSDVSVESLRKELIRARPNQEKEDHLSFLLIGQIGAGKSSFINSVRSAFKGYVSSSICTGSDRSSLTLENTEHVIRNCEDNAPLHFRIWDTKGLEQNSLQSQEYHIIHTIKGPPPNMMKRFLTIVSNLFTRSSNVNLSKFHCVAFVVDGTSAGQLSNEIRETFNNVRRLSIKLGVPQVVLLTKVDQVCPMVYENPALTFHSKAVQDQIDLTADLLGMPRHNVLPVKNYESEFGLEYAIDKLTLLSVRQMIRLATDIRDDFDV